MIRRDPQARSIALGLAVVVVGAIVGTAAGVVVGCRVAWAPGRAAKGQEK